MNKQEMIEKINKDWNENPRWDGITRNYTAEEVVKLMPSIPVDHSLAKAGSNRFTKLLKEEAYVLGEGDPSPAVVTFTTEAAAMAVNEWLAGVTGLAGAAGMVPTRMRRFHARDERRPLVEVRSGCPCCDAAQTLGRGDVQPFLDMVT